MSAHMTPEQVRSKIDHPIVDGDGHWVEYDPVFSEKMRKVGGDLAADGFLKAMGTTREALKMTVAERREKRIGQSAFWSRQAENTLDRATAMMPSCFMIASTSWGSTLSSSTRRPGCAFRASRTTPPAAP